MALLVAVAANTAARGHVDIDTGVDAHSLTASTTGSAIEASVSKSAFDPSVPEEIEPNDQRFLATPLNLDASGAGSVRGMNLGGASDTDYYSFQAEAGDRLYVTIVTERSGNSNSMLAVLGSGPGLYELDDNDGNWSPLSSNIAGVVLPGSGTHFIRVTAADGADLAPYRLYYQLRSGTPSPEAVPDAGPGGESLPDSAWVSGTISDTDLSDTYSIEVEAGETLFIGLDTDPARTGGWQGSIGLGPFDGSVIRTPVGAGTAPYSDVMVMSFERAATYQVEVSKSPLSAATGGYHLSVARFPAADASAACTTYASQDPPKAINGGFVLSALTIPDQRRIADIDLSVKLTHQRIGELDINLISPSDNDNSIFSFSGSSTAGAHTSMDVVFDDEAALAASQSFPSMDGLRRAPSLGGRLHWFDGENAAGSWVLAIRDRNVPANTGTLTAWSLRICEPPPLPACPEGSLREVVYESDFEADDGGFTFGPGADNDWQWGVPPVAGAIGSCESGQCWHNTLSDTTVLNEAEEILSPVVDFSGMTAPVIVEWSQRISLGKSWNESQYAVQLILEPPSTFLSPLLFWWTDPSMLATVGNPPSSVVGSSGWARHFVSADAGAGESGRVSFLAIQHTSGTPSAIAIDDVRVTACRVQVETPVAIFQDGFES